MDLQGPKIRTRTVLTPEDGERRGGRGPNPDHVRQAEAASGLPVPGELRDAGRPAAGAAGAKVSIKDGLIVGHVEEVRKEGLVVAVTRTPPDGQPLEPEKGINFPGTDAQGLAAFGRRPGRPRFRGPARRHGRLLLRAVGRRTWRCCRRSWRTADPGRPPLAIVAKIETQLAFKNLPEIIAQAAGSNPFAVMIARGDLAVEIGYERLSEVQEEILWVCEAAHVPVIWATQVLESLVKRGMPSRGEFTDAAMGNRAECVMLNKGPHVAEGITVLDNVLRRMEAHMTKKSPQLRALAAWTDLH